jgi:hypothetical protein
MSTSNLNTELRPVGTWILSTAERAIFTFAFTFFSALIFSDKFNIKNANLLLFPAAAAGLSVITAAVRSLTPPPENGSSLDAKVLDVVTRVGLTLLQTFTAAFVTSTAGATHFSDWRSGAVAGVAAAFTALKGASVAKLLGGSGITPASAIPARLVSAHA